jgi:hypothetical protein
VRDGGFMTTRRHPGACYAILLIAALTLACGKTRIGTLTGPPLNPEAYRAQIVAIDAILFEDRPLGEAERDTVGNTLLVMGRFAESDTTNTIAKTLGQNMRTLASLAKHTKVGTPLAGSRLRQEWLRIRGSLFDDAAWFRRSSADSIEPSLAGPPPRSALRPANAHERAGLDQTLFSLTSLTDRARRDLPNEFASDLHRQFASDAVRELELDSLLLGPVPPQFGIDVSYQSAYQYTADALRQMRILVRLGTGDFQESREFLVQKADENVGLAQEAVGKMMR